MSPQLFHGLTITGRAGSGILKPLTYEKFAQIRCLKMRDKFRANKCEPDPPGFFP